LILELQKWLANRAHQQILGLLVGGLLARVLIALWLYPGFDEAYYYLYTLHPDWSYFDHPVLVALTTGFGPWLTGSISQFTLRLGTLILYTGSLIFLYQTGAFLFNQRAARLTLAIASMAPIFLIGFGLLTLPDSPLMFFWALCLYVTAHEFFRQPDAYCPSYRLAIIGLVVGLACLGKYHGFVLGVGLIGFCLTNRRYRPALASPWTGLGFGLFLIAIGPILFWNAQHEWISIRFQSARGVPDGGYNLLEVIGTFLTGVLYLFPTIGIPLWWVSLKTLWQNLSSKWNKKNALRLDTATIAHLPDKQSLILWLSLPLILGFAFVSGYTQVLPTWQIPGFWTATLLLGQQAAERQRRSPRLIRRWLVGSALVIVTILAIALSHIAAGTFQKPGQYALLGGFLPPSADASVQLIDIQQLRQGFVQSPELMAALKNTDFVFTNRYYLAGQVAMAIMPLEPKPITCFDRDLRGLAFWSKADQWVGQDALYITTRQFQKRQSLLALYQSYFESMQEIGAIPIRRGGTVTEVFFIYQAKKLLKPYPRRYGV
jgi:4-amino-4-deoxy-L-arabinose transferase-like glycosyltransferase